MEQADQHEESPEVSEEGGRTIDLMILDKEQAETQGSQGIETDEVEYQPKGLFRSFGTLLADQKPHWYWYAMMLLGSLITGGKVTTRKLLT